MHDKFKSWANNDIRRGLASGPRRNPVQGTGRDGMPALVKKGIESYNVIDYIKCTIQILG